MTSFGRIYKKQRSIVDEYYEMIDAAEDNREREENAAIIIQKAWRGFIFRKHFGFLNIKSTKIQSTWRMFYCKIFFSVLKERKATTERRLYFDHQATKIQRVWRGYWARTHTFDFYKQQRFLVQQSLKNAEMAQMLENYYSQTNDYDIQKENEKNIRYQENFALRNHHLVSTSAIPSIFTPNTLTEEGEALPAIEQYIKSLNKARIVIPVLTPR